MIVRRRLEELEEAGRPIRVGIVGMGAMGAGVLHTMKAMAGMRCVAAADLDVERAVAALAENGLSRDDLLVTDERARAVRALERDRSHGRPVVTSDGLMLASLDLDVILEATGSSSFGARVAYEAILAGKHVAMLTVEADVVVGPLLARMARSAGVVYTLVSGDQPGAILELAHWAETLGLQLVAAGRGTTRYSEDRAQGPGEEKRGRLWISNNPKMANSFRDGTKAQIEMAAVSNATGLVPDVPGMHEAAIAVDDLARVLALREHGGILARTGVIELANSVRPDDTLLPAGRVGNGVFVVVDSPHPGVRRFLRQAFAHQGERAAALFRPYHLTCVEVPVSIARAALLGVATAAPRGHTTEVVAAAKRDLAAGETLDGGGGSTVYALVEAAADAARAGHVPFALAEQARLARPVARDEVVTMDHLRLDRDDFLYRLRQMQDASAGPGA
jgi:predicted homoserine dehydrogenase-like protein